MMGDSVDKEVLSTRRMLPLRIAALRKRIQRPSYVPVDRTGNRVLRTNYLSGAEATEQRSRIGVVFASMDSEIGSLPNLASNPNSPRTTLRPKSFKNQSCWTANSSRPKTATTKLHSNTALPARITSDTTLPACITSDYGSSATELQYLEHSENSTPDFDVLKVELSPLSESMRSTNSNSMRSTNSDYTITASYPSMTSSDEPSLDEITSTRDLHSVSQRGAATATSIYVSTCKMLNIPVSKSLYKFLSLSTINLKYHALSELQVKAFAVGLTRSCVSSLDISATGLTDRGFGYLCDVLHVNYTIKDLFAADNKLSGTSAHRLALLMDDNGTVECLDMSGNSFKDQDAVYFAEIIKINPELKRLCLRHNLFGAEASQHFGRAVGVNNDMTTLDLSWNQFRKHGASTLIDHIRLNSCLRDLNLSWNGLSLEGCEALAEYFKVNTTLTSLDITSNRITQEALRALSPGLIKNKTLEILKVGKNPITSNGVFEFLVKLKFLELSSRIVLPSLKTIDFSDIIVSREVIKLHDSIARSYPNIKFIFGFIPLDMPAQPVTKQHHTNLTSKQARDILYQVIKGLGLTPEHVLPKNPDTRWQVLPLKDTLQAMSVPLTSGAIDLILQKIHIDGTVRPSEILSSKDKMKCRSIFHHTGKVC